jgi:diguanylate cyclase (GGDEF)-like protein/PAS domain S-box-containing protein
MEMRGYVPLLVLTAALFIGLSACQAAASDVGVGAVVVFGDDVGYPPFSYLDDNREPAGFSVELVQAIGEVMGWHVIVELDHWANVMKKLENGEIDAIAGMFYTDERAGNFDFSVRHSAASGEVFARAGHHLRSLEDLRGQRVAVQEGDIVHEYLRAQDLDIEFVPRPTPLDALRLVAAGEVDYGAVLRIPGYYAIESQGLTNLRGTGLIVGEHNYSIAVRKGNTSLLLAINEGLQILKATGRFDEIYSKWIGVYEAASFVKAVRRYALAVGALLVLSIAGFLWAFSLRRAVATRTQDIQAANAALEQHRQELETAVQQLTKTTTMLSAKCQRLAEAERDLADEKDLLRTTLLSVGEGVIVTDLLGTITMVNPAAEALTGWPAEQAIGREFYEVFRLESALDPLRHVMSTESLLELEQEKVVTRDERPLTVASTFAPILDAWGQVRGGIVVFRDITAWVESQERIKYLSYRDPLTDLYNRRYLQMALERYSSSEYLPFSVVMVDVNGLKLTNDAFGHAVGDELLLSVAASIREVVGDFGCSARLGGDEFVLLLPNTAPDAASDLADQLREVAGSKKVAGLPLSIALGWDTRLEVDRPIEDVLRRAEDRMYKHKLLDRPNHRAQTIAVILQALYDRIPWEKDHAHRVAELCRLLGDALEMYPEQVQKLYTIGLLHDIGKLSIDWQLLLKPGPLTDEEKTEIQRHAEMGYRIIGSMSDMVDVSEYVLSHHERFDGSGYPRGLVGRQIPFYSRIVAVADAWDAITNPRPHRAALSLEEAASELRAQAGSQFDPRVVEVFLAQVYPRLVGGEAAMSMEWSDADEDHRDSHQL